MNVRIFDQSGAVIGSCLDFHSSKSSLLRDIARSDMSLDTADNIFSALHCADSDCVGGAGYIDDYFVEYAN